MQLRIIQGPTQALEKQNKHLNQEKTFFLMDNLFCRNLAGLKRRPFYVYLGVKPLFPICGIARPLTHLFSCYVCFQRSLLAISL